jgi:lysophospholipase L1-like esterase
MTYGRNTDMGFLRFTHGSPIRRIGIAVVCLFSVASCDKLGLGDVKNPTAPGPPTSGSAIIYAAIGASDANGVGSSVPCVPLDHTCPGMGYVHVAARQLTTQGFSVSLTNLGLPTAVIGRDFETLGQQFNRTIIGNFIDQEMPFVPRNSTVVTIFAGGNEVNAITAALGAGAGGSDPNGYIDNQIRAFGVDYNTLLNGIRERAGSARIVILNTPNMAGLPYLSGASTAQRQAAQRAAIGMTRTVVNPLGSGGTVVVDLMCDSRTYQRSNYSSDGLHPNDAGYAFMAAEVVRAVTSNAYPAPQANCSAMSLVQ